MLQISQTIIEEEDSTLLNSQQKNVIRAIQTDIGHFSKVFSAETSGAEITVTPAVTTGRHPQGPLVPISGSLPSTQPPSSLGSKKIAKKHICEHCGKEFSKMDDMKNHIRSKHPSEADEDKPYCQICKKTFYSKGNLKLHVKSKHNKEFIHKCEFCAYGTNYKQTLASHKIKEHTSKEEAEKLEKFTCNICQKQFVTKQLLQKHLYSGTCSVVQRTFECTECKPSKWLKSKKSLEKHTKQHHTGELPVLKCPYQNCQQTCVNSSSLKKHIAWHKDIEKKEKEREEYLKRQKQHYEDLKKLSKKKRF